MHLYEQKSHSDIGSGSMLARIGMALMSPFTKSVQQGAATTVYCAVSDEAHEQGE